MELGGVALEVFFDVFPDVTLPGCFRLELLVADGCRNCDDDDFAVSGILLGVTSLRAWSVLGVRDFSLSLKNLGSFLDFCVVSVEKSICQARPSCCGEATSDLSTLAALPS